MCEAEWLKELYRILKNLYFWYLPCTLALEIDFLKYCNFQNFGKMIVMRKDSQENKTF